MRLRWGTKSRPRVWGGTPAYVQNRTNKSNTNKSKMRTDGVREAMTNGDRYRARAAELEAMGKGFRPEMQDDYLSMARWYRRLAEQADRNSELNLVYETPLRKPDSDRNVS
jgi:hypothetical protein